MLAPVSADLIAPVLAVSASDDVAVASGRTDEDAPQLARAAVLSADASHRFSAPLAPPVTQAILAAGYLGRRLVLVTATSAHGVACCSSAATQSVLGRTLQTSEPLASGLDGAATGALVRVRGGLLAAVDNQAGITVARSDASGDFAGSEPLVGPHPTPPVMAAGTLHDGGAIIAWTAPVSAAPQRRTAVAYNQPRNQRIEFATAGPSGLPGRARLAVTVPAGRQIDALGVIAHPAGATLAWTESGYVGSRYQSQVFSADVTSAGAGSVQAISPASAAAVGLSLAGSSGGSEVLTWQACDIAAGTCVVQAALRPHGDGWGTVLSLGSVDPTSFPVAAQSRLGQSLVSWISGGTVSAAAAGPGASDFDVARQISSAHDASDLSLVFGAGTQAVAVWVQGTFDQQLVGARFTP